MITTYNMASGELLSLSEDRPTSASPVPEWQKSDMTCPRLGIQEISIGTSQVTQELPPDLAEVDVETFIKRQP